MVILDTDKGKKQGMNDLKKKKKIFKYKKIQLERWILNLQIMHKKILNVNYNLIM